MISRMTFLAAIVAVAFSMTACKTDDGGPTPWRTASKMVIGEGTDKVQVLEGEALVQHLRNFEIDTRSGFRLSQNTKPGYMVIGDLKYRVTVSCEMDDTSRQLITIHSGADPIHLRQR